MKENTRITPSLGCGFERCSTNTRTKQNADNAMTKWQMINPTATLDDMFFIVYYKIPSILSRGLPITCLMVASVPG